MKIIIALIVLGSFSALSSPRDGAKQQSQTNKQDAKTQGTEESPKPPVTIQSNDIRKIETETNTTNTKTQANYISDLFAPANIPNWALVLVGAFGVWYAGRTLGTLVSQTKNADKSFRAEQRAWVGVQHVAGELRVGKPYVITILLKNTGRTPAKDFKIAETSRSLKKGEQIAFTHESVETEQTAALLMPTGIQRVKKLILNESAVTESVVQAMAMEEYRYVVYGTLTYRDVFDEPHWTTYYFWLASDGAGYIIGPNHNDTGDGSPPVD